MLSQTMQDAINEQIKNELYSAYLYLSMAAHFDAVNLPGFSNWMKVQYQEEVSHAMKFYEYVFDRGGRVKLQAIPQPETEWNSNLEVFQQVLAHEQKVTGMINHLYELALKENDFASQVLLHWYINEQVEEEKNASAIIAELGMIEERSTAVLMLDKKLGKRGGDD